MMAKTKRNKKQFVSVFNISNSKGIIGGIAIVCILVAIFTMYNGTSNTKIELSEREAYRYNKALAQVTEVDSIWESIAGKVMPEQLSQLITKIRKLKYDYNDNGMSTAAMKQCDSLQRRIEYLQTTFVEKLEREFVNNSKYSIITSPDLLLTGDTIFPFYLKKGELLFLNISSTEPATIRFRNSDIDKLIKEYHSLADDTISITNDAVYLVEIKTQVRQYTSVEIAYKPILSDDLYGRPVVKMNKVECEKEEKGAVATKGLKMKNLFEEPRKFTLRGQIKAAFSGSAKALVAVQVPAGATDILYSMRIDTSEGGKSDDGKFHRNLNYSYRKINMLGLPVYESAKSSGILNMILDDNRPIRDEDAYCNMYVFRNQAQAKKFQDNATSAAELKYDVDYSTLGTQSCNGRIPVNGSKTIYLGFENERMRYANYLWVEVVAVVPSTLYFKEKYTIK